MSSRRAELTSARPHSRFARKLAYSLRNFYSAFARCYKFGAQAGVSSPPSGQSAYHAPTRKARSLSAELLLCFRSLLQIRGGGVGAHIERPWGTI